MIIKKKKNQSTLLSNLNTANVVLRLVTMSQNKYKTNFTAISSIETT